MAIFSRKTNGVDTLRYVREDRQGSVAAILTSSGGSYIKESFSAFGARRNSSTWSGPPPLADWSAIAEVTRHGYTWHTYLGTLALNDMNGRVQDAVTGRFLSADPSVPEPTNTQAYNRYSYVYNNPLTFTDPSGFAPCTEPGGPGVLVTVVNCGFTSPGFDGYFVPSYDTNVPSIGGGGGGGSVAKNFQNRVADDKAPVKCPKPKPADFSKSVFLNNQYDPASLVGEKFGIDPALLLGVSAKETGWGSSSMYRNQNNPFGATPRGDATPGITYDSYYSAWNNWGRQWGSRLEGVESNTSDFICRLGYDNRNLGPAIDHRGSYNSEDASYPESLADTIRSVQKRLDDALKVFSPECN